MKKSTAWIIGSVVIVAVAAMIVPGSPFNILDRFIMNNQLFTAQHDGRTVTEWIGDLNATDDAKKILAIKALGSLGVNAKQALPQLAKIMTLDPDNTMRIEASLAISKMAPDSLSVLDSLIKGLDDKDAVVRMNSLFGIMRLKADSKGALKALVAAANLPVNQELATGFTTTLQEALLVAIGRASAGSSESVPMLMGLLNSKDNP
ncbi:MAG: HEAT repeat domain-containing protein, partial [Gemmataceae bacterium]